MGAMQEKTFCFRDEQMRYFKKLGRNAAQWLRVAVDEKMERDAKKACEVKVFDETLRRVALSKPTLPNRK